MNTELSREELARYGRHISIPEVGIEGQARLRESSVLVVGARGLGSPAAIYLAAAGVGRIGLIDHDDVEISNLQRQILYGTNDVGKPKPASARDRLTAINPHVEIETYHTRLDSSNARDFFCGWDFVVDGSDNFPTRYLINDTCVLEKIPFAYGAILRFEGQASVFATEDGPCYRCLFRDPPPQDLVPNCAQAGVLGALPGIVGSIQAIETIKWLLGIGGSLNKRLLLIDALQMEFRNLSIQPDPDCVVCGSNPSITELIDYEHFCQKTDADNVTKSHTEEEHTTNLELGVHHLKEWIDAGEDFQLIDVRENHEWNICNLAEAGAELIPLATLPEAADRFDSSVPLVIHCRTGPRAQQAVAYLRTLGYDNAVNLTGGIHAWAEEIDQEMPIY